MMSILYIAAGGALGAVARYSVTQVSMRAFGPTFPIGTMSVNVFGSFLMGLLAGYILTKASGASESLRLFLGVGLLGGFTTFSAFSLDSFILLEKKAYGAFFGYVSGSVVMAIAALALGLWVAKGVFSGPS